MLIYSYIYFFHCSLFFICNHIFFWPESISFRILLSKDLLVVKSIELRNFSYVTTLFLIGINLSGFSFLENIFFFFSWMIFCWQWKCKLATVFFHSIKDIPLPSVFHFCYWGVRCQSNSGVSKLWPACQNCITTCFFK